MLNDSQHPQNNKALKIDFTDLLHKDPASDVSCCLALRYVTSFANTLQVNKILLYLFEYKSHFSVPENWSKNGMPTYTRGYVK